MDIVFPGNRNELDTHLYVVAVYQLGVYSKGFLYLANADRWQTLRGSCACSVCYFNRVVVLILFISKEGFPESVIMSERLLQVQLRTLRAASCASKMRVSNL